MAARLGNEFFTQSTRQVARQMLGKRLVRITDDGARLSGVVVEVEAYLSRGDLASHSHRGSSKKNATMFSEPGRLYVYSIHAKHCLNVVTEPMGQGAAVLIRALEPDEGIRRMLEHRGLSADGSVTAEIDLKSAVNISSGPARLCQALAIDRSHDGLNLATDQRVWLEDAPALSFPTRFITRGPRIGISQSTELALRWFLDGHHFVSGLARAHSRGRH
ncbi:MAG: DNA-3-methyladenine glycosylase, partial [Aureliella sp.]